MQKASSDGVPNGPKSPPYLMSDAIRRNQNAISMKSACTQRALSVHSDAISMQSSCNQHATSMHERTRTCAALRASAVPDRPNPKCSPPAGCPTCGSPDEGCNHVSSYAITCTQTQSDHLIGSPNEGCNPTQSDRTQLHSARHHDEGGNQPDGHHPEHLPVLSQPAAAIAHGMRVLAHDERECERIEIISGGVTLELRWARVHGHVPDDEARNQRGTQGKANEARNQRGTHRSVSASMVSISCVLHPGSTLAFSYCTGRVGSPDEDSHQWPSSVVIISGRHQRARTSLN